MTKDLEDPLIMTSVRSLIDVPIHFLVAKTWDFHVDLALGISLEENIEAIKDSVLSKRQAVKNHLLTANIFLTDTNQILNSRLNV